jgi:hypothetical protein
MGGVLYSLVFSHNETKSATSREVGRQYMAVAGVFHQGETIGWTPKPNRVSREKACALLLLKREAWRFSAETCIRM